MNKVKSVLFVAGISFALSFTFGCSSGEESPPAQQQEKSSSSEGKIPNHCVYMEEKLCLHGANPCPGGGTPSEECPFQSSNSVSSSSAKLGSSSAGEAQAKSSSSESERSSGAAQEQGYCLFETEKICMEIETSCPSSAQFSKTCPYLKECDAIFNPDNKFCYDGVVYDKCDGMVYNPTTHICQNKVAIPAKCGGESYNPLTQRCTSNIVQDKCGNTWYNQATQFCADNKVYTKCNDESYDPLTHGCIANEIVDTKCGNTWYNQKTQECCGNFVYSQATLFCVDDKTYAKCNGKSFDPVTQDCCNGTMFSKTTQRCTGGIVEGICGNTGYNQAEKFCYDNIVYDKCSNESYNPLTHGCVAGEIVNTRCGNSSYSPSTQFCYDNKIYDKCSNESYNPLTHGCVAGEIVNTKCGNTWYSQSTQFCYNSNKVGNFCGSNPQKYYNPDLYECKPNSNGIYLKGEINAVLIGEQVWMAENLNINATDSKCYNNNCTTYGRLYSWVMVMGISSLYNTNYYNPSSNHKGICPSGWHIPTNAEWDKLLRYVDGNTGTSSPYQSQTAGKYLKATSGWDSGGNGTDVYGFSALPGGYGNNTGGFYTVGAGGYWWTTSEAPENTGSKAYRRYMSYGYDAVYNNSEGKNGLISVRCLQD